MRAAISLLVLLFSMCGTQTWSTQAEVQAESQDTGAAAEVSTKLDVSAELQELRDMVVELKVILSCAQDKLKDTKAEMKTEVDNLKAENAAQEAELTAVKTRLAASEAEVKNLRKEVEEQKKDSAAHEQKLAALKTKLAATETEVENLEKEIKAAPKVAFSAFLTNSGYIEAGNTALNLVFSKVLTNVGQAYSGSTGFFTAPVRGVYYFRFSARSNLNRGWFHVIMNKNGQQVFHHSEHGTDGRATYLNSGVALQLEVGDEVNLSIRANQRVYDDDNNHTSFTGFLLFPL